MKLITVNVEGENHHQTVIEFIKKEDPDILCMQEVMDRDTQMFKEKFQMDGLYVPTVRINKKFSSHTREGALMGVMMLTKFKAQIHPEYYAGDGNDLPPLNVNEQYGNQDDRLLLIGEFKNGDINYRIITTHFTWSSMGQTTKLQLDHLSKMLNLLKNYDEFILCGDFNAPRESSSVWQKLSVEYKDNIPSHITNSLDPVLFRKKDVRNLVDGIFSTPDYKVEHVRMVSGISDHQAVVAEISRHLSGGTS